MAKAIEQTPVLEGNDAERFLNIVSTVDNVKLTEHEKEIKKLLKDLPANLKI